MGAAVITQSNLSPWLKVPVASPVKYQGREYVYERVSSDWRTLVLIVPEDPPVIPMKRIYAEPSQVSLVRSRTC